MMIECAGVRATLWLDGGKSIDLGQPTGGGLYGSTLRFRFHADAAREGGSATSMTIYMGAMHCTVKADAAFAKGDRLTVEQLIELGDLAAVDA